MSPWESGEPYLLAPAAYVKSLDSEGYADECRCLMHLDHHAESGGMGDGVYLAAGVHPHFQLLWQRVRAHQQCCACWQPCGCVRTVQMQSCMSSGSTSEPAEFPPQVLSLEPRVLQWVPSQNKRCTGLALDPCDAFKRSHTSVQQENYNRAVACGHNLLPSASVRWLHTESLSKQKQRSRSSPAV